MSKSNRWSGLAHTLGMVAGVLVLGLGVSTLAGCAGDAPTTDGPSEIGTVAGALGELCKSNDACGDEAYCRRKTGQCSSRGHCAALPEACAAIDNPVCGCDGRTYGSRCDAARTGVSVAQAGPCPGDDEAWDPTGPAPQ